MIYRECLDADQDTKLVTWHNLGWKLDWVGEEVIKQIGDRLGLLVV